MIVFFFPRKTFAALQTRTIEVLQTQRKERTEPFQFKIKFNPCARSKNKQSPVTFIRRSARLAHVFRRLSRMLATRFPIVSRVVQFPPRIFEHSSWGWGGWGQKTVLIGIFPHRPAIF